MRLIFMGTAPFACPTLARLLASQHQVLAVVTRPDRPRGRGRKPAASAVKTLALEHHLPVLQPAGLRAAASVEALAAWQPEIMVVVAYGHILPPAVLRLPPYGCINLHASLLPKYRGPAPVNWALIEGETVTGCTIIQMDDRIDTGPMLWSMACPVTPDDDAISLGARLAAIGAMGMDFVLTALDRGALTATSQPEASASQAPKLTRDLGRIDWHRPAGTLHNLVRGLVPWPGATATWRHTPIKLWRTSVGEEPSIQQPGTVTEVRRDSVLVACGEQHLLVRELQPADRRRMTAGDFVQGYRLRQGDRFD